MAMICIESHRNIEYEEFIMKKTLALGVLIFLLFGISGCKPAVETEDPNDIFSQLPSLTELTLADEVTVVAARAAYEKLSLADKDKIKTSNLTKLENLENKLSELKEPIDEITEEEEFREAVAKILSPTLLLSQIKLI